jgi:hypothetical protein
VRGDCAEARRRTLRDCRRCHGLVDPTPSRPGEGRRGGVSRATGPTRGAPPPLMPGLPSDQSSRGRREAPSGSAPSACQEMPYSGPGVPRLVSFPGYRPCVRRTLRAARQANGPGGRQPAPVGGVEHVKDDRRRAAAGRTLRADDDRRHGSPRVSLGTDRGPREQDVWHPCTWG